MGLLEPAARFVFRTLALFLAVFAVYLCIYGVAAAVGSDDPEGTASTGIVVVGVVIGVVYWVRTTRRTGRWL
jgi:ABC-type dipeptide/oligopeptide/nickel transport system permease subunit